MVNLIQKALGWSHERSKKPWASFEVSGFEESGRIKVSMSWNRAFIKKIYTLGFRAETEEDSVQLFFYTAQARPIQLDGSNPEEAVSSGHPNLQADTNTVRT